MRHYWNKNLVITLLIATPLALHVGCGRSAGRSDGGVKEIQNAGSDTMVNLAQAWAEAYAEENSRVQVAVAGGGSGTGIAALINGTADIANCSRAMKEKELAKVKTTQGAEPRQFTMGLDALAVYVHKDNPLDEISIEQLGQIFGEGGIVTMWSQLGVEAPDGNDEIIRVSRQSNSGTYVYFKETVVPDGKGFKLGSRDMHGSKDVVELVGKTPSAIGYSGMGYATDAVKMLEISMKEGDPAYAPNMDNAVNKTYPVARPLYMYTLGEPEGHIKTYIDWCFSEAGQQVVVDNGYVPAPKK